MHADSIRTLASSKRAMVIIIMKESVANSDAYDCGRSAEDKSVRRTKNVRFRRLGAPAAALTAQQRPLRTNECRSR